MAAEEGQKPQDEKSQNREKEKSQDESDVTTPPRSPDGGYGWVVVLSAFFTFFISDGFAYAFGVLYSHLLEIFQESRSTTAWIPSLFYGLPLLCGPISGALATKYGCRTTQIVGGLMASFGVFVSAFANSVQLLYLTFGIVTGFGMSMGYVTSLVTVAFYFEKKRALATGIAVSGSGFGTFAFAPFFEILIAEYEWRGTLIILSALTLNLVVCGALLRPVTDQIIIEDVEKPPEVEEEKKETTDDDKIIIKVEDEKKGSILVESVVIKDMSSESRKKSVNYVRNSLELDRRPSASASTKRKLLFKRVSFHQKKSSGGLRNTKSLPVRRQFSSLRKLRETRSLPVVGRRMSTPSAPVYRTDLFYHGNLSKIKRMKDRPKSIKGIQFGPVKEEPSRRDITRRDSAIPEVLRLSTRVRLLLELMFDRDVLRTRLFLFFLVSNFILYFWYDVPYVYIVDHAEQNGVEPHKATFLVSIIGILTTFGQILFGFLGDKDLNMSILYGIPLSLAGASVLTIPIVKSFVGLSISAAAFGFFVSVDYALDTCLMVEFVGMDKLTSAYGISMMFQGIANLLGPPVAGAIFDLTGVYKITFYTCGACIMLSGVLVAFIPTLRWIKRTQRKRMKNEEVAN